MADGAVRIGDTVRRPAHARSAYVRAVLEHLAAAGFDGAPRLLGVDDRSRDVLAWIPGEVVDASPARLTGARVTSAARLVRAFHDATAGTALAGDQEVVCHGDLGPHNIVFAGDAAVAIIDWDEGVAPGPRLADLGHLAWCCADVGDDRVARAEQARRLRLVCDGYGWADRVAVVDEIGARWRRAHDAHARAGRAQAAAVFASMLAWMDRHGPALRAAVRD